MRQPDSRGDTVEARRRKLMMKAREWGLTKEERCEVASYLLRRDITTWSGLDDEQVHRLLDGFEFLELMLDLARMRVSDRPDGRCEAATHDEPHSPSGSSG